MQPERWVSASAIEWPPKPQQAGKNCLQNLHDDHAITARKCLISFLNSLAPFLPYEPSVGIQEGFAQ
jgi:hypothetical protein